MATVATITKAYAIANSLPLRTVAWYDPTIGTTPIHYGLKAKLKDGKWVHVSEGPNLWIFLERRSADSMADMYGNTKKREKRAPRVN